MGWIKRIPVRLLIGAIIGLALIALYAYISVASPWLEPWNDVYIGLLFAVMSVWAALMSTLAWREFQADDLPRAVWGFFSLGLWFWAAGETIWAIYYLVLGADMPDLTLADLFWILGFGFFAATMIWQFRLLYRSERRQELGWLAGVAAVVLLISLGTAAAMRFAMNTEQTWLETYVAVFYPWADLAIALPALYLARLFEKGAWGRMWLGLVVNTLADSLYSWLYFTGYPETSTWLSVSADVLYLLSYLILALLCHGQVLLLRYGPSLRPRPEAEE